MNILRVRMWWPRNTRRSGVWREVALTRSFWALWNSEYPEMTPLKFRLVYRLLRMVGR